MRRSSIYIMSILLYTILFSQEKVEFTSASPFGLKDIITSLDRQKTQQVEGVLKLPKGKGPFPLVLGVAGSLDWSKHHLEYLEIATWKLKRKQKIL